MRKGLLKSALLGAAALGAISLAGAGVAHANPVQIGFATSNNGAAPTNFHTGTYYSTDHSSTGGSDYSGNTYSQNVSTGHTIFDGNIGIATLQTDIGTGSSNYPPPKLVGSVSGLTFGKITNNKPNTLWVYITETGLQKPLGSYAMASIFTTGSLSDITSVTESTYLDNSGNPFAQTTFLASKTFHSGGTSIGGQGNGSPVVAFTPSLTNPYSITEVFTFVAKDNTTGAAATASIQTADVPEPGSLALLGTGLLGLGLIGRRRRRKA